MAFCRNISAVYAVRFLLGIFEAGMLPGIAYYLSRWYRRNELTFRLSLYMVMTPLAGAFGGILASAILTMDRFGSLRRWRMIFGVEGIVTCVIAVVAFMTITDRPTTAWWLSPEEKDLAIARIKSERIATTEVLDSQGLATFLPTIIKTLYPTNSVVSQQLHTVPPYAVGVVVALIVPYLSYKLGNRQLFFVISAPTIMIGYAMFLGTDVSDGHTRYAATFLIASCIFNYGSLVNAQVSANVVSDTARAAAIGANTLGGTIGGLISTWSYLPGDAPNFRVGSGINLATASCIFLVSIALYLWMLADNKRREKGDTDSDNDLVGMSQQLIQDLEWKHPHFRWRP